MRGWVCSLVGASALTAVVVVGGLGRDAARAGHEGLNCGIVSDGPRDYRVRAQQLNCDKATRGAKRYLRSGGELTGFSCDEPAGRIEFFCKNGSKFYWSVRL